MGNDDRDEPMLLDIATTTSSGAQLLTDGLTDAEKKQAEADAKQDAARQRMGKTKPCKPRRLDTI